MRPAGGWSKTSHSRMSCHLTTPHRLCGTVPDTIVLMGCEPEACSELMNARGGQPAASQENASSHMQRVQLARGAGLACSEMACALAYTMPKFIKCKSCDRTVIRGSSSSAGSSHPTPCESIATTDPWMVRSHHCISRKAHEKISRVSWQS